MVAAVVYVFDSAPLRWWPAAVAWLLLLALLSFLMVSTWRYRSFKDFSLLRPRSPLMVILLGAIIYLTWNYSQVMFLAMGLTYVGSGILIRIGGLVRRKLRHRATARREPELSS
jgi:CDP-diacylglycerol--serine O-phosphatidyltransferase